MATTTIQHRGATYTLKCDDDGLGYVTADGGSLRATVAGYVKGGRIEWLDGGEVFKLASRDPDTYIAVVTAMLCLFNDRGA